MKLALLAVCVGAFLAVPGIAAAATPQGHLTGSGTFVTFATFGVSTTVTDGGTSYVGQANDLSGTCDGDSGQVTENGSGPFNVVCAHYVQSSGCCNTGSPKMRLAYPNDLSSAYNVVRITDNGDSTDTFALGTANTLAEAQAWVNKGAQGSAPHTFGSWSFVALTTTTFVVTP